MTIKGRRISQNCLQAAMAANSSLKAGRFILSEDVIGMSKHVL